MKKLVVTSIAAVTLALAAASGAQAVDRLPIVKVSPPATTAQKNVSPGTRRLPCSTCDNRPPVGRYPPGYTPPATSGSTKTDDLPLPASTSDFQPPVGRYPPGVAPPAQPVTKAPPVEVPPIG
jgi:hypothetical protein